MTVGPRKTSAPAMVPLPLRLLPHSQMTVSQNPPVCAVPACTSFATYAVRLIDRYAGARPGTFDDYDEPDITCRYLCDHHQRENEAGARLVGKCSGREWWRYPFTNRHGTSGRSAYRSLRARSIAQAMTPKFRRPLKLGGRGQDNGEVGALGLHPQARLSRAGSYGRVGRPLLIA